MADKGRERLTVYVDSRLEKRFRDEAEANYRSLSDHMNAILSEYYETKDAGNGATDAEDGQNGRGG